MRDATIEALRATGLDPSDIERIVSQALAEDLHDGEDVTSMATVPSGNRSVADYVVRQSGVIAGLPILKATLEIALGDDVDVRTFVEDGATVASGDVVATVTASTIALLAVERVSLNLLCRLSGIATSTRRWVEALAGTAARVRDTRKTTPGLRHIEKYAVRCGGGVNHRQGLYDAVLIKDNHVVAAGGVIPALEAVLRRYPRNVMVVQVEVDTLGELDEALAHGATQIMLDNMSVEQMAEAVRRVRTTKSEVMVEASGGLSIDSAASVARTGVDFLAVGALTHSSPILDIALDFRHAI